MSVQTLQSMVRWIDGNLTKEPSLLRLSAYVGYSPGYCSAKFHAFMKISYKQYVAQRRIQHAASDVAEGNEKLLSIALKYGFSSHEAFTRAFASQYGCTPKQYRNKHADSSC
ncbi:helix-turn-helix transcriptional regulator [Paenibacillus sp. CAU 1782]